jgi:dihydrofolate reductase
LSHEPLANGLTLVAAVGRRGELGRDGGLLFRLKADMAHFRAVTRGCPVIMGRRTWDSFPRRPLPGRRNIVLTRNDALPMPGAFVTGAAGVALEAGRTVADRTHAPGVCVIGGAEIYALFLPLADTLWLTEVAAEADADVFFPELDLAHWRETARSDHPRDADNEADFVIRRLERRRTS